MGFSVSGAAAIIFVSMFVAFGMWYTATSNSFDRMTDAQDTQTEGTLEASNTALNITEASYDGTADELTFSVNNTGATAISLNKTSLLVNGSYEVGWQADNATVNGDSSTDLWLPGEQLTITLGKTTKPDRVKIVTAAGVAAATEVSG